MAEESLLTTHLPRFRDGSGRAPLPPSLRAVLASEQAHPVLAPLLASFRAQGRFACTTISQAIRSMPVGAAFCQLPEDCAVWNDAPDMPALVELAHPGDQRVFLYVIEPDAHGEIPILRLDDQPEVWLAHSSFAAYLASLRGSAQPDCELARARLSAEPWLTRERFADDPRVREQLDPGVPLGELGLPAPARAQLVGFLLELAAILPRIAKPHGAGLCGVVRGLAQVGKHAEALALVRASTTAYARAEGYGTLLAHEPRESERGASLLRELEADALLRKSKLLPVLRERIAGHARHGQMEQAISLWSGLRSKAARDALERDLVSWHLERCGVAATLERWPELAASALVDHLELSQVMARALSARDAVWQLELISVRLTTLGQPRAALDACEAHPNPKARRELCFKRVSQLARVGARAEAHAAAALAAPSSDHERQIVRDALDTLASDVKEGLRAKNLLALTRVRIALAGPALLAELQWLFEQAANDFERRCLLGEALDVYSARGRPLDARLDSAIARLCQGATGSEGAEAHMLAARARALVGDVQGVRAAFDEVLSALRTDPNENTLAQIARQAPALIVHLGPDPAPG